MAYLDGACLNDPTLRAKVNSLLGAHDQAGSFGESPAFALAEGRKRLSPGSQLGSFRIEALLGAGGMGEVYRAHDTKLQRAVAIKVLPDSFAHDPDRRSRFDEEARALAALNHPHVGAIYGVEESGGIAALILELVDGPTLSECLAAGPLPVDETIRIARQLAEGLEAAHDRGIVHRDLKPANIKITTDGNVKILDFGLAKPDGSQLRSGALGWSPLSPHATRVGVIVGTAGYMSPEQARGQAVDRRTDIWAFGCVLFEICAHQPPFAGGTVAETLTAVIDREPDWAAVSPDTPPHLVRLLRRCLTKDAKLRLRDIGEARIALLSGRDTEPPARSTRSWRSLTAVGLIAASTAALVTWLGVSLLRPAPLPPPPLTPVRFAVSPPEGGFFNFHPGRSFLALSPDGSQLAVLASTESAQFGPDARGQVFIRALNGLDMRPVPGTEGATSVFWSPDGRSLGFFTENKLRRIDLPDGAPVTICDLLTAEVSHGTWGAGGVILIAQPSGKEIQAVAAAGGVPHPVITRNPSKKEVRVHWPWFLPDGAHFIYTARLDNDQGEVRVGDLEGNSQLLIRESSNAQWVDPNIVVFVREGVLMAQRVDPRFRPIGDPFSIADHVEYFYTTSRAMFTTSRTGTVAYHAGGERDRLVWTDRSGKEVGTAGTVADYEAQSARLSHDGQTLLTARRQQGLGTYDIWRINLARSTEERVTYGRGSELTPVWIDHDRAMAYAADSPGSVPHLYRKDLATGAETEIRPAGLHQLVVDVLPHDDSIAYAERSEAGEWNVFQVAPSGKEPPRPLVPTGVRAFETRASPDGRALAFVKPIEGRLDLYVSPLPVAAAPVLAAASVRSAPRWSADGLHLYYLSGDGHLQMLPVRTTPVLTVGLPQALFKLKPTTTLMDVAPDGRFLMLMPQVVAAERPIIVSTAMVSAAR